MIPLIWIGAALFAGAVVVGVFWNEIKEFVNKSIRKIREIVIPSAIAGFKTFLQTGSVARALYAAKNVAIQKFYSRKETGQWQETVITREISEKDIPADILAKINRSSGKEVDITDEVAEELHLENI